MHPCNCGLAGLAGFVVLATGCNIIAGLTYFFGPPQIQKAEFKLTDERLVVLFDWARPEEHNPVFRQALHDKLIEIFRDNNVRTQLVPQEEVLRLRQENPDFGGWSVQKVGRRLNARQVLWIRIDRLQLREAPGSPLLVPVAHARLKVIGTDQAAESGPRLWPGPQEPEGRPVARARQPREATSVQAIDDEAAKLGRDLAWLVAQWFYDVDLEKKTPWEP